MGNTFGSNNKQSNNGGEAGPETGDDEDNASFYDSEDEIDEEQIEDALMIEDEESDGSANGSASSKSKADKNGAPVGEESIVIPPLPEEVPTLDKTGYVEALKQFRLKQYPFKAANGKWSIPYRYTKEADALNPLSTTLNVRMRRIQKEIAQLHDSLPVDADSSIFVCTDENRPDLVKALIVGPADTPYQNGVFEFDVFFPAEYPHKPPLVTYVTTGGGRVVQVRFNPNLYANGYVCLSVINTWQGKAEEQWNPYLSLHKVLLAIQSMVLVPSPFFNEPGFGSIKGKSVGDRCSDKYNNRIKHATLKHAMLEAIRKPPPYFKDVILMHFRQKRQQIQYQALKWFHEIGQAATSQHSVDQGDDKKHQAAKAQDEDEDSSDIDKEELAEAAKVFAEAAANAQANHSEAAAEGAGTGGKKAQGGSFWSNFNPKNWFNWGSVANMVAPMGGVATENMKHTVRDLLTELERI